jgi:hypothetical protein
MPVVEKNGKQESFLAPFFLEQAQTFFGPRHIDGNSLSCPR